MSGTSSAGFTGTDLVHLRRCVELAREALAAGEEPFGSLLVDGAGEVRAEDINRTSGGDHTRHPEFELARWAAANLTTAERAGATVYTSGEHCPMCAAAHGWVGLGRIVYAASAAQLTAWRREFGWPDGPVAAIPAQEVAPLVEVLGPEPELAEVMRGVHREHARLVLG
ncbi:nucleoside deaminase [Nocardioides daejeonensis]|uniref:nucleoside deaminase n=1 Tax=Nocardioides daejeonensis TaxID=1046556 RepID=UPI000D741145|nr:nucleoside deaminase [Nocardioides daejeonensis]